MKGPVKEPVKGHMEEPVKGLTLARQYFDTYGDQFLAEAGRLDPSLPGRMSIGLVGEGSQCFGYDDDLSCDHDFAPGFCVFVSDGDFQVCGPALKSIYDRLPGTFQGFSRENMQAEDRLGVMSVSQFYGRLTGMPQTNLDWLFLTEASLATAVNGQLWLTGCEEFASVRNRLLHFYPEDVRRKKIAARAAVMSQAGQYNLLRSISRKEELPALFAMSRFAEAAISMVHLLGRRYAPFYKWAFRSLQEMAETDPLAKKCCPALKRMPDIQISLRQGEPEKARDLAFHLTEAICQETAEALRRQNLSRSSSNFLQEHLTDIMSGIEDPQIRAMHPMIDPAV